MHLPNQLIRIIHHGWGFSPFQQNIFMFTYVYGCAIQTLQSKCLCNSLVHAEARAIRPTASSFCQWERVSKRVKASAGRCPRRPFPSANSATSPSSAPVLPLTKEAPSPGRRSRGCLGAVRLQLNPDARLESVGQRGKRVTLPVGPSWNGVGAGTASSGRRVGSGAGGRRSGSRP